MSKIQILKATHNPMRPEVKLTLLFHDVKDTNFESNSQLKPRTGNSGITVSRCQRYKF